MSPKYSLLFNIVEGVFRNHHGSSLREEDQSIAKLVDKIMKLSSQIPIPVLKYYIKCRIHFRIKLLNRQLYEDSKKKLAKLTKVIK